MNAIKATLELDEHNEVKDPKTYLTEDQQIVLSGKCPCETSSIRCYNFFVTGMTGTGKTTLIDSFINYLMGIDFFDKFRYKLIYEDEEHDKD